MSCRSKMSICVLLLLVSWSLSVSAAQIDPELKKILDEKSRMEVIPVLMVFPDPPQCEDIEVMLEGATPRKRRKSVIAALKRQVRKAQSEAWEVLEDPNHPGTLEYANMLYFSNALAFGGDSEIILAVAESGGVDKDGEEAILFYDKEMEELISAERGQGGMKSAQNDTVWNVQYIQANRVWNELGFTGEGVLIGQVDTGIDYDHPDLRYRLWTNGQEVKGNGLDDDGNGLIDDTYGWDFGDQDNDARDDSYVAGHGTHTAGTAVGDGHGGVQTGVAPGAKILPVKVFTSGGTSSLGRIWAAQQYCAEMGARIITMSMGIKGEIPEEYLRNDRFNAEALRAAGIVFFNSAGNYHSEFSPPIELGMTARIPAPWNALNVPYSSTGGVISVGGTAHRSSEPYSESSQGPVEWSGVDPWNDWPYVPGPGLMKPDIVAPAMGIRSCLPSGRYSGENWNGTSMACPQLAGVAALMLEKNPTLSPAGIDSLLELTAIDLGMPGKDQVFGSGLVNAYAAVQAVPMDYLPNLEHPVYKADSSGNGVLDPGEILPISVDLSNVGMVPATGVVGRLSIDNNPFVSVHHGTSIYPDIPAGEVASNDETPFLLEVSPSAPQGAVFVMNLIMSTSEGFERIFDLEGFVGMPEHRTHDAGEVYLTVTARGSLGYLTDARQNGDGLGMDGGMSSLFISSLWGAADIDHVCNNDLTADGADPADWKPRQQPNGNVAVLDGTGQAQAFSMAFTDSAHNSPLGLEVELMSLAFTDPMREDVVVLNYQVINNGNRYISSYCAGVFADFDVVDAMGNIGGTDPSTRSVWVGALDGPVYGMALLGTAPAANITLVDNPTYVFPFDHVPDVYKYQFLRGNLNQSEAVEPTDLAALVSAGPFTLDPGQTASFSIVMAYGDDLEDFQNNITAAGATGVVGVDQEPHVPVTVPEAQLALGQNHPNPFNPTTDIKFSLAESGPVELAVYDITGRLVKTLVSETLAGGVHTVRWDGRDQDGMQAASGLYFYRMTAEDKVLTRKMLLVK